MKATSFADHYCALHGIRPDQFNLHLLKQALYPHARLVRPLLEFACPNYFAADNDFVCEIALLTRYHEFYDSSIEFVHHPENRGLMRRLFLIRVSTDRMRRIVRRTLRIPVSSDDDQGTMSPLGDPRKSREGEDASATDSAR